MSIEMDFHDALDFAEDFVRLGWAVQEQLQDMVRGDFSDINPNAAREIFQFLDDNGFGDLAVDFEMELREARRERDE